MDQRDTPISNQSGQFDPTEPTPTGQEGTPGNDTAEVGESQNITMGNIPPGSSSFASPAVQLVSPGFRPTLLVFTLNTNIECVLRLVIKATPSPTESHIYTQ
ncbi:hypothetical protein AG1IA_09993 [Rhizoctonia solani AG-1 IA]|uniref:Uncharacterized protein n=1 Tax=Thanatephorus cucumeris (strain AG1-IA) TaxID=983506 RepID=L8WGX4_THACA|nr:hypothetical protein AG1IA_09993 [Rhizoctonia solani AG-1 IA]